MQIGCATVSGGHIQQQRAYDLILDFGMRILDYLCSLGFKSKIKKIRVS